VRFLVKAQAAVPDGGLLAFTLKEGDGEGWSTAKLELRRYFVYWREAPLREALDAAGWEMLSLDHVMGRAEPWLFVICRRSVGLRP
jgi:predicted TPR repeat methyltransferase